jgi:outer membrane lipoprotein-sorting protein/thioredoxin-related protein
MRRTLGFIALLSIAAAAVAGVVADTKLINFEKALTDAKSVKATYTVQTIGSSPDAYNIALKKPNLARLDTPTQLIVADGSKIYVLDKAQKAYYKKNQTEAELKSIFSSEGVRPFAGFFDATALDAISSKDLGKKNIGGNALDVVEAVVTPNGKKVVTYYLDPENSVARKTQIDLNDPSGKVTTIVDTKSVALNTEISEDTFKFTAPDGAREVSMDEVSAKWFTDLDEAKKIAAATGRKIFVDFFAEWCGPCKRLEADCFGTKEFKDLSKKLVFLRIDVDKQPKVSQAYGITAMPTQMVVNPDGSVVKQTVGYANRSTFFNWIYSVVGR